jgi:hypothetical protein
MKVIYALVSSFIVVSVTAGVAIATVHQSKSEVTPIHHRSPTPEPLSSQSTLTLDGIGPVRVGMTTTQAEQAAGVPIPAADTSDNGCGYTHPQGIENLLFMVVGNQIARVDVVRDSPIRTTSGAGIGNTAAEIEAMYPGQIEVWPHKYVQGGHYLVHIPTDAGARNYGIVFETDENDIVTQLRSGKLPEVTWVEGCF